jgi:hypothetical protein
VVWWSCNHLSRLAETHIMAGALSNRCEDVLPS